MSQTLKQQEAALEAKLSRVREKSRQLENGQKIIFGGMLINAVKKNAKLRTWLIEEAEKTIKRDADKKRIAPILDELKAIQTEPAATEAKP